jgi:hypothetical protein
MQGKKNDRREANCAARKTAVTLQHCERGARSVVGGRRGGPAKHRVRENDRPTRSNLEGPTVTNIIITTYFGEFSQPGEKKKGDVFEKNEPKSPHYEEK